MNQLKIDFNYQGKSVAILCSEKELMKDIINRYSIKSKIEINSIYCLYAGDKIDENLTLEKIIRKEDKNKKKIDILVYSKKEENRDHNKSKVKSTQAICPECGEITLLNLKNYNLSMNCKKNHKFDKMNFEDFDKKQIIDESKIICENCRNANKSTSFNKVFFICLICKKNLCPLCKTSHEKSHYFIKYEEKDSICYDHRDNYNLYCKTCNKNLCASCENKHLEHEIISLGRLIPKENNFNKKLNDLKDSINKFKEEIKNIINILNKVQDNMDKYYKISKDIFNSFNIRIKNYEMLSNIKEVISFDDNIMNDIDKIIKEKKIYYKFIYIFNIYCMMDSKEDNNIKDIIEKINNKSTSMELNNITYVNYLYQNKKPIKKDNDDENMNNKNKNDMNIMNNLNNMNNMIYNMNMNYMMGNMNNMNNMMGNMNMMGSMMSNMNNMNNMMSNMNMNNMMSNMNTNNMNENISHEKKILTEYMNLKSKKLTVTDVVDFIKNLKKDFIHYYDFLYPEIKNISNIDLGFNGIKLTNNNIFEWEFTLKGPKYSPYSGGLFHLKAFLPKDYPDSPPEICFITPIYHLEVNPNYPNSLEADKLGNICSPILNWWDPKTTMLEVILSIFPYFYSQIMPESSYGLDRAEEFKSNNSLFEKKMKFFTHKYADPSLPYKEYNNSWDFSYTE